MVRMFSDQQVAQIRRNLQTVMVVLQDDRIEGSPDSIAGNLVYRNGSLTGKRGTSEENGANNHDNLTQHMGISSSMLRLIIFSIMLREGFDIF